MGGSWGWNSRKKAQKTQKKEKFHHRDAEGTEAEKCRGETFLKSKPSLRVLCVSVVNFAFFAPFCGYSFPVVSRLFVNFL
jgi:hypothetical protein